MQCPKGKCHAECLGNPWASLEEGSLLGEGLDSDSEPIKKAEGSLPAQGKGGAGELGRSASIYIKLNAVKGIL